MKYPYNIKSHIFQRLCVISEKCGKIRSRMAFNTWLPMIGQVQWQFPLTANVFLLFIIYNIQGSDLSLAGVSIFLKYFVLADVR